MNTLLDNTALHSAGRALGGRGRGLSDGLSLVHLCYLYIFFDEIVVPDIELAGVSGTSKQIIEDVEDRGLDEGVISLFSLDEERYLGSLRRAADEFSSDFSSMSPNAIFQTLSIEVPDVTGNLINNMHKFMTSGSFDISNIPNDWTRRRGDERLYSTEYFISSSIEASNIVRNIVNSQMDFTKNSTLILSSIIRYYINSEFSSVSGAAYAPSIGRSILLSKSISYYSDFITNSIDKMDEIWNEEKVSGLSFFDNVDIEQELNIPSVFSILMERSKGEINGLIEQAHVLRENSSDFRSYIRSILRRGDNEFLNERAMKELSNEIVASFKSGVNTKSSAANGLSVSLGFVGPSISISPTQWINWVRKKKSENRFTIFSDLIKDSNLDLRNEYVEKFIKSTMHIRA